MHATRSRQTVFNIAFGFAVLLALVSSLTVYLGASNSIPADGTLESLVPPALTAMAMAFRCVVSYFLFAYFPRMQAVERLMVSGLVIASWVIIFFVATQFTIVHLGGQAAVEKRIDEILEYNTKAATTIHSRLNEEAKIMAYFEQMAGQFAQQAQSAKGGGGGIKQGDGEVFHSATNVAQAYARIAKLMKERLHGASETYQEILTAVGEIKEHTADVTKPWSERLTFFSTKSGEMNGLLGKLNGASSLSTVLLAIGSVEGSVVQTTTTSQAQVALLDTMRATIRQINTRVEDAVKKHGTKSVEIKKYNMFSPLTAIFAYWREIPGAWAFGLALDFAEVIPLFFLVAAERLVRKDDEEAMAQAQLDQEAIEQERQLNLAQRRQTLEERRRAGVQQPFPTIHVVQPAQDSQADPSTDGTAQPPTLRRRPDPSL